MVARVTLEIALGKSLDYNVPHELADQVRVGTRVQVPLGRRKVFGVVTELADRSEYPNLKPVLRVVSTPSLLTVGLLRLARWMSEYYCCSIETCLKSVLPVAVRREQPGWRQQLFVRAVPVAGELPRLSKRQLEILHIVEERRELPLTELLKLAGTTTATVRRLEDKGLVVVTPQVTERDPYAHELILPTHPLELNPAQAKALEAIKAALHGTSAAPGTSGGSGPNALLTSSRQDAGSTLKSPVFLLHGVTGSGKTEVYLQAIAHALELGKGAIVLVPEISLTPQTVERFKARFCHGPNRTLVAVLHSHLSAGERHDEWHKIRQGRARIVIGARSAIFAPVHPLGLIIVDEEHEQTYKQEEAPRYHARDVAIVRGQLEGAVVVLGSATPSLESYYNARRGKYTLLELPERVDGRKMPFVRVIDMREAARKAKGVPIFSGQLREAITRRLERGEQVILFLNRRGYSTALECPLCGYVAKCVNCSIALTYHRREQILLCHICGHTGPVPLVCPNEKCRSPRIRYAGLGTERVEETLAKMFPFARIGRMDSDVMKRKEDYRRLLADFRAGKLDVLVGTQMIAKGLHFPNVTLVGIIYADLALHQPDFRAAERTFQLLTQVAGRAGRGDVEGEVLVQAFTPYHPAIQYARRHDFNGFYEQEIEFRRQLRYPPFTRVALLTLKGRNSDKVKLTADYLKRALEKMRDTGAQDAVGANTNSTQPLVKVEEDAQTAPAETPAEAQDSTQRDLSDLIIAGPAPAPVLRAKTYYRYQIVLRTRRMTELSRRLAKLTETFQLPEDVTLTIDIDPVDLL
ncbi:MAG: primosomal protein N' [Verrucomicrobiae bacterium]|nr:primosomal protein N' [Verrucomicrobiae bacterium]